MFDDNKETVIGIVSWSYGCADERYPGIYTDVVQYKDWISKAQELGKNPKTTDDATLL